MQIERHTLQAAAAADSAPAGDPGTTPSATPVEGGPVPSGFTWDSLKAVLPPDLRDHTSLRPYGEGETPSGFPGLVRDFVGAQALIGREKVAKPNPEDPKDVARFWGQLGTPPTAKDYDLKDWKPPEGVPWDAELQSQLIEDLHGKAHLTQDQMRAALDSYAGRQQEAWAAALRDSEQAKQEAASALRAEWGQAADANFALAERAWRTAYGEAADDVARLQLADGSTLGDHPLFLKGFAELGSRMAEDRLVGAGRGASAALTPAQAQAEIDAFEAQPNVRQALTDRNHPEHKAVTAKRKALYEAAFPT